MTWVHYLLPPVIGAVIGYITNFLAIRMLFRPTKAVYIGKWHVPFTPGIIPKRKNDLAHAIAELVAERFFTDEDIRNFFLSEEMHQAVEDGIRSGIDTLCGERSVWNIGEELLGTGTAETIKIRAEGKIYTEIRSTILHSDLFDRVESGARYVIRRKLAGTLLQKIVSEKQMDSISKTVSYEMQKYMYEHMEELLLPLLTEKTEEVCNTSLEEGMAELQISRELLYEAGRKAYQQFAGESLEKMVRVFDIVKLTEEKIITMDPVEVEALCNRVIKREMQAVIYLGALLGAIIGLVNIFI